MYATSDFLFDNIIDFTDVILEIHLIKSLQHFPNQITVAFVRYPIFRFLEKVTDCRELQYKATIRYYCAVQVSSYNQSTVLSYLFIKEKFYHFWAFL